MDRMAPPADEREIRNAFGCFPSGVTAVCAFVEGNPVAHELGDDRCWSARRRQSHTGISGL